ncbi:MAG: biotin/lipoyl-binding protein, partial [Myxococcota bacterium]|nr:biotin/lipoyl-binding protein [Myxococcota bacterium]
MRRGYHLYPQHAQRLAVVVAMALVACHRAAPADHDQPTAVAVKCVPAQRSSVDAVETLRGRVATPPGGDLPVASQVPGRVLEVLVHEGDHIASGALVASIDGST